MRKGKVSALKIIRVIISILVFSLFLVVFLGEDASLKFADKISYFQFIPSLIKFLFPAGRAAFGAISLGFLSVLVLTFIFGRIYCAALCPLGILQDIIIYISGFLEKTVSGLFSGKKSRNRSRVRKNPRHNFIKPVPWIGYVVLTATVLSALMGSLSVLILVDPYSIFARTVTNIIRPFALFLNNSLVRLLEALNIYLLLPIPIEKPEMITLLTSGGVFAGISLFAVIVGRHYCNTICPVGILLRLIARFSLFRIFLDQDRCTTCGICEKACRAGCINSDSKYIDTDRCVMCFDCISPCPVSAVHYAGKYTAKENTENIHPPLQPGGKPLLSRRKFIAGAVTVAGASAGTLLLHLSVKGEEDSTAVIPPGAQSTRHFVKTCTACHLCVTVCPTNTIQPAFLELGFRGIMQPVMNYNIGYCEYECNRCVEVCPADALKPVSLTEKKVLQLGKVFLNKEECIVYKNGENCAACAEVCSTHAVYTELREGLQFPETDNRYCTGCGFCQYACPVTPKTIIVRGSAIHGRAVEPYSDMQARTSSEQITMRRLEKSDETPLRERSTFELGDYVPEGEGAPDSEQPAGEKQETDHGEDAESGFPF